MNTSGFLGSFSRQKPQGGRRSCGLGGLCGLTGGLWGPVSELVQQPADWIIMVAKSEEAGGRVGEKGKEVEEALLGTRAGVAVSRVVVGEASSPTSLTIASHITSLKARASSMAWALDRASCREAKEEGMEEVGMEREVEKEVCIEREVGKVEKAVEEEGREGFSPLRRRQQFGSLV